MTQVKPMSTINLRLPSELRNRFKAACAHQGIEMRLELITMLERYIKWEQLEREAEKSES